MVSPQWKNTLSGVESNLNEKLNHTPTWSPKSAATNRCCVCFVFMICLKCVCICYSIFVCVDVLVLVFFIVFVFVFENVVRNSIRERCEFFLKD